jgi:hypothetical protein
MRGGVGFDGLKIYAMVEVLPTIGYTALARRSVHLS